MLMKKLKVHSYVAYQYDKKLILRVFQFHAVFWPPNCTKNTFTLWV